MSRVNIGEQSAASTKLENIQSYVRGYLHPARGTFGLPQTSVPACLASRALWAAFISWSFGPQTAVSNSVHAIAGAAAGLIFGGNSFLAAFHGTNKLLKEIDTNVTNILTAMQSAHFSDDDIKRLNAQIEKIPAKPQPLSWSQIVNVAFAWYTATITSFTSVGAFYDAAKSQSGSNPTPNPALLAKAATFSIIFGICALLLAYYGQREQAFLTQVNNKLKELIAHNPALSAEINKSAGSAAIHVRSAEDTKQTPLLFANGSPSPLAQSRLERSETPSDDGISAGSKKSPTKGP